MCLPVAGCELSEFQPPGVDSPNCVFYLNRLGGRNAAVITYRSVPSLVAEASRRGFGTASNSVLSSIPVIFAIGNVPLGLSGFSTGMQNYN